MVGQGPPYDPRPTQEVEPVREVLFGERLVVTLPGQRYDAASGLNQNGFRDGYDSGSGRYTQPDPLGLRVGPSIYGYVNQGPLGAIDPYGLAPPNQMRAPSAHSWRPNAQSYPQPISSPRFIPGTTIPLPDTIHDPTSGYWESAAQQLSPWDYTMVCVDVWCMRRVVEDLCSTGDTLMREPSMGGYLTVIQVYRNGCICRKALFRDQVESGPETAGALDIAELAARVREARMTRSGK